MSESANLVVLGLIAAVVLSAVWVRWRAQRRKMRPAAVQADPSTSTPPGSAASSPSPSLLGSLLNFARRRSLLVALIALGLGGFAQYSLADDHLNLALICYGAAAILFVVALHDQAPEDFTAPTPVESDLGKMPASLLESAVSRKPSFWSHWRYYTVADLLAGRKPHIPTPGVTEPLPSLSSEPSAASTLAVEDRPAPTESQVAAWATSINMAVWAGGQAPFITPSSLATTPKGDVIVLDTGRNVVYQVDPSGAVLNQWAVPQLPAAGPHAITISPDGNTLYIADSENHCIYVIRLSN